MRVLSLPTTSRMEKVGLLAAMIAEINGLSEKAVAYEIYCAHRRGELRCRCPLTFFDGQSGIYFGPTFLTRWIDTNEDFRVFVRKNYQLIVHKRLTRFTNVDNK
jgi:hypothetical protein